MTLNIILVVLILLFGGGYYVASGSVTVGGGLRLILSLVLIYLTLARGRPL